MTDSSDIYDVIVIGADVAGLTTALFTARAKLSTLVFGHAEKSMLSSIQQIKHCGAKFIEQEVVNIVKNQAGFQVKTTDNKYYQAKTIVLATGLTTEQQSIKNQDKFLNKGIHSCACCNGWFYKSKKLAVIGHSNHAAQEAIELLSFTKDIAIISNGKEFDISPELKNELEKNNIQFSRDEVVEFQGEKKLEKLLLNSGEQLQFDGVFLALGSCTALTFAKKLALDSKNNLLAADKDGKTSTEGIYAVGECVGANLQIAKSAGEGCNTAAAIIKKLKGSI